MPEKGKKVPVTLRALIARINRKLKPEYQQLKITRGERWSSNLGAYYVVDFNRNTLLSAHVDPENFGRQLGVLKDFEEIVG